MLIVKPDYYEKFHCTADQCEDTCCAGWQIVIDEETLETYRRFIQTSKTNGEFWRESAFEKRLKKSIDWKESVFYQDKEKRCAFLNDNNLCDLYTVLGEENLCRTCTNYPRHIEEFENVREYTLSVSCPEAAKIVLNQKEPVFWVETETGETEEYEDFDFLLYDQLLQARKVMLQILQDRRKDIRLRAFLVWEIGREMQKYADEENLFACEEIFEKYRSEKVQEDMRVQLQKWQADENASYQSSCFFYKKLYELELLREDWDTFLQETAEILYASGEEKYGKLKTNFTQWMHKNMPDYEIWLEQLLVYWIQTYFCGAVYDGYIASKAKLAVVSTWLIYEMLAACWHSNNRELDMEDVISVVYRYSRELEHSEQNLGTMDELLDE